MSHILNIYIKKGESRYEIAKRGLISSGILEDRVVPIQFTPVHKVAIHTVLTELSEKYDIKTVHVFLPFFQVLSTFVEIPLTKKADIEDALPFELEGAFPLPINEYACDFSVVSKEDSLSKVLALCVKRDVINDLRSILDEAGLPLSSVQCSFMKTFAGIYGETKREHCLFVHIEGDSVNVAVVKNGHFSVIERIGPPDQLAAKLERVKKIHEIEDVLLAGDMTDPIRAEMGVSPFSEMKGVTGRRSVSTLKFDFVRSEYLSKNKSDIRKYSIIGVVLSGVFLIAGFFLPIYRDYGTLKNTNAAIEAIKADASALLDKRKDLETTTKKVEFLRGKRRDRMMYLRVLKGITDLLPLDAWVISLDIDSKGFVEVKGLADNTSKMVEVFEKSKMFKNAGFSAPILKSGDKTRFSIKMELER